MTTSIAQSTLVVTHTITYSYTVTVPSNKVDATMESEEGMDAEELIGMLYDEEDTNRINIDSSVKMAE